MTQSRSRSFAVLFIVFVCAAFLLPPQAATGGPAENKPAPLRVSVSIPAAHFEIAPTARGDEVRMDGFGRLPEPGVPMLPARIFGVAVPPGAEVQAVTVAAGSETMLDGTYDIAPVPMPRLVLEEDGAGNRAGQAAQGPRPGAAARSPAVYGRDAFYPAAAGELVRPARYRKYELIDVRVAPFAWNPKTKKLLLRRNITIHVDYTLPAGAGSPLEDNLPGTEAVARGIVANYTAAQSWYGAAAAPARGGRAGRGLYDFVIITTDSLATAVQPFADWETEKGRTAAVVTTSQIYAGYSGYDEAEKIRNFLRDKYPSAKWGIEDVLIVGHYGDVPMRRCAQDEGYGEPETDFYYAELSLPDSQSWDADGDHRWGEGSDPIDFYNEVNVGRVPWSSAAVVESIGDKSAAFEQNADPGFKRNILLLGGYFWSDTDNAVLMEYKTNPSLHPWMAAWTRTRLYEKNTDYSSSYPCDYPLLQSNARSVWSAGKYGFVNWAGHGSPYSSHILGLGSPAFISTADCPYLNDDYPAVIFADACSNSDTDHDNIGREMLKQGAVGFVGATKVAYGVSAWSHPNHGSGQSFDYYFTARVTSGDYTQGEAHQSALRTMYTHGLWYREKYEMFEWGALWGNPDLSLAISAALAIAFPDGAPDGTQPPGAAIPFAVTIEDEQETYLPGTALLHYRYDPAGSFAQAALAPAGAGLFEAELPAPQPGDAPEFYVSAQGDGGTVVTMPAGAPEEVYSFDVAIVYPAEFDDFETDKGWTVENVNVQAGGWERADPAPTDTQPGDDHSDPGALCWVTGPLGGSSGTNDLDGGPTRLISPAIDLSAGDALLRFYVWFYHSTNGTQEPLKVHLSNNNGSTWTKIDDIVNAPQWTLKSYRVSDYLAPTDQMKIRVVASDEPNDSVVEALVDDFAVERIEAFPGLCANAYSFCNQDGCSVDLYLEAGAGFAGRQYVVGGGMSGTVPGTFLPGGLTLPLNRDGLTQFILARLNWAPFQNFLATLDGQGRATARLNLPAGAAAPAIGRTLCFAFTLPGAFDYASNPVMIDVAP